MTGIYKITNLLNSHFYIGLSNNIDRRWQEHKTPKNIKSKKTNIAKAFRKYGIDNFKFEIIEICEIDKLSEREQYYIMELSPIYNMNNGGKGNLGHKLSDELKILLSQYGKKQWESKSEEEKKQQIKLNLKGPSIKHKVSVETREKLRKSNLGKIQSKETVTKRSNANKEKLKNNTNGNKKVIKIDRFTGETLERFESLKLAAENIDLHPSNITKVLKGVRKSAGGYYWKYL